MKTHRAVTVYLPHTIGGAQNFDPEWKEELKHRLRVLGKSIGVSFRFIDPIKVTYLIKKGGNVKDNSAYAAALVAAGKFDDLKRFMERIWGRNATSVDRADMNITWVKTRKNLVALSRSVGTIRELSRANDQRKPSFLICETPHFKSINKHFLHLFLKYGAIFRNADELIAHLVKINNKAKMPS